MVDKRLWYQTAVFYEIFIRSFYDTNNDGWGDIPGVTAKLDYLKWLGVDCLWLMPFFASPMKDGGYDVADFYQIHPNYGTLEDLKTLIAEAHKRDIRVIGDLVLNHTSDEHPWFQEARDPSSPKHNWYVWSDTPDKYANVKVIFKDVETSNWQWDEKAKAYYWHRFYHFQPDLNYDNPEVREEILNITRYWLELGLDGFRLDAVPYLFAREGTTSENLPETHQFLKRLRQEVEKTKPDAVLLAETNQKLEYLTPYFGHDDECHMAFHFPVMAHIFDALRRQSAVLLDSVLAETPALPPHAQWTYFLRNHDEVSVKYLPAEYQAAFLHYYADDLRGRFKLGLRRRLAPMLQYSPYKLKLVHALLLSLPGSPMLYYGDEIALGENLDLTDRNTVRTPMPWNSTEHLAGFSGAEPSQLPFPLVDDAEGGWHVTNVHIQSENQDSLLNWIRHALEIRRQNPALQSGAFEPVDTDNEHILAYRRVSSNQELLCIFNFSDQKQHLEGFIKHPMRNILTDEKIIDLKLQPHGHLWLSPEN